MVRPASHIESTRHVPDEMPRFESLVHMLQCAVEESPERLAIVCGEDRLSYRELGQAAAGLASRLAELGVAGSRVAILMPNSVEHVVAFFAAMAAHAQAAPANPFFTARELSKVMAGMDAAVLVCISSTREMADKMASELGIPHVIDMHDEEWSVASCIGHGTGGLQPGQMPAYDDLALLIYTGGTTGTPKGVNHHHRTLMWSILLHCAVWPVDIGHEVILNVAPLFHIWGLGYGVVVSVYSQGTFVLIPRFDAAQVLRAIDDYQVTIFGGGPAPIYAGLVNSDVAKDVDFSSLKYCLSGGAPCSEDLHRRWEKLTGCPISEGWGMSEGAPFCVNSAHVVHKLLSVGPPVPETEIEIVDLESGTTVLPMGEPGEIRARGPQIMSGYRNSPEETAHALRDGWMHTGDIGFIDEDGYVHIVDRKKDMVIVGGYNVYPREIDELLFAHPKIREATTVGRPHERLGEVLVAFVVLDNGEILDEEQCLSYCRENLVKYKRPVAIRFLEELPRTAANKIDKISLRKAATQIDVSD
jgi:long-chain acyl-CoA synthetase